MMKNFKLGNYELQESVDAADVIIVGSGFSGSIVARELAEADKHVLIIEKRDHIAGNMYDYTQNGVLTHKYGPHILYFDSKKVFEYLTKYTELVPYFHKVYANVDGKLLALPINLLSLKKMFKDDYIKVIDSICKSFNSETVTIHDLLNNEDTREFGKIIYQKIFLEYSKKMWGIDPMKLDIFVMNRIPIRLNDNDHHFTNKYQFMPKDGYTKIFNRMLDHKNIKIVTSVNFNDHFKLDNNIFYLNGKKINQNIIYTGSIDELFAFRYGVLQYRSLEIRIENKSVQFFQDYPVVNYPDNRPYTRITDMNHLNCQNHKLNNTVILTEYPGSFNLNSNRFNDRYYPLPSQIEKEMYNKYFELSKGVKNLYLLGRLAQYQYINMEKTIINALNFLDFYKAKM